MGGGEGGRGKSCSQGTSLQTHNMVGNVKITSMKIVKLVKSNSLLYYISDHFPSSNRGCPEVLVMS